MPRYEIRLTGSGGQGVILASVILAEAAVIEGLNAIQSQSYGPEARGGASKAETIIGEMALWFSKVTNPNLLLALTQESLEKYSSSLPSGAIILVDSSIAIPKELSDAEKDGLIKIYRIPIISAARDELGKPMTANIVAVGAINALAHLFSQDSLKEAVRRHIPSGTEEINMRALDLGYKLARG